MRDYPIPDLLHLGFLKLLLVLFRDPAVVENLFILSAFPLSSLSAYFVFRRLQFARMVALVPSVLFACTSFHFIRMCGHQFVATYYPVPLMLWLVLKVAMGWNPFLAKAASDGDPQWRWFSWPVFGTMLVCILVALGGVYYAFFSCFLLLVIGVNAALRQGRWVPLAAPTFLIAVVFTTLVLALAPSFLHWARAGRNREVAGRSPVEADVYGLKVSEMLLPTPSHRLPFLSKVREKYLAGRPNTGEVWSVSLGIVASLGFIYLMLRCPNWIRPMSSDRITGPLSHIVLATLILGTVGGVGTCFNFTITPMIRCYNRISIFISFLSLCGLFFAIQQFFGRRMASRSSRAAYQVFLATILVFGVLDQVPQGWVFDYGAMKDVYESDRDLGARIEAALPTGAMVYQMPQMPFPEHAPICNMGDYELLRPYFHTTSVRWSYGALASRDASLWQGQLEARPLPEQLEALAFAGFQGIYLDRRGFNDNGVAREARLADLLGVKPIVSLNGRQSFFDMGKFVHSLHHRYAPPDWAVRREESLHPLYLRWGVGFGREEEGNPDSDCWRWCGPQGHLQIINTAGHTRNVVLTFDYSGAPAVKPPAQLVIEGERGRREYPISPARKPLTFSLTLSPGKHSLRFSCDGTANPTSGPNPGCVFRLWNFKYQVKDASPLARHGDSSR